MDFRRNNRRNTYPFCYFNGAFSDRKLDAEVLESVDFLEMNPLIETDREATNSDEMQNKVDEQAGSRDGTDDVGGTNRDVGERNRRYTMPAGWTGKNKTSEPKVPLRRCHSESQSKGFRNAILNKEKQTLKTRVQGSPTTWKRKSKSNQNTDTNTVTDLLKKHVSRRKTLDVRTDTDISGRKKSYSEDEVLDTLTPLPVIANRPENKRLYKRSISEPLMHIGSLFSSGIRS